MTFTYLIAWLLPWATGTGLCVALHRGMRGRADMTTMAGNGFFVGVLLAAALTSWLASADTQHAFTRVAPWLAVIGVMAWATAFVRHRSRTGDSASPTAANSPSRARRAVWFLLFAALVIRLWLLGSEALMRPTFPWDAWSAWAIKPKTWFELGHYVAYVDPTQWLANPGIAMRTSAIWDYPELLAWIQVWFASAAGSWNEPLVNVAWTGALAALALASYGQWRALGLGATLSLVLAYALVSLPLVGAHTALAGYADLWLAALFGVAVLAWLRWMRGREAAQLALAALFAFCMPLIKLEGAVWLLGFSIVAGVGLLPLRWRWKVVGILLALAMLGIAVGGFLFPMFGLGWVHVSWGQIVIPALGALDLHWRPVGSAMLSGLLTLPNWHLLWYVVPVVVAWRWRALVCDGASTALAVLLGACAAFLFVLFFFTDASAWAENYTSANRLILHVVPAVFSLLALLLAEVSVDSPRTDPAPPAPIDQA